MHKSRLLVPLIALAIILSPVIELMPSCLAGYSSGKSSFSRSSSSGSRSSGSNRRSSSSSSHSSSNSSSSHSGKGSSYSSGKGGSYSYGKSSSSSSWSSHSFGAAAATAKRAEESRSSVSHYTPPPTPSPRPMPSSPPPAPPAPGIPSAWELRDRQIAALRSRVSADTWYSRPQRVRSFFGRYMTGPSYSYHDHYSPWFWLWLLDRPGSDQSTWLYHHRYSMDPSRYDSLVSQNAALRQQIADLESRNVMRDPTYTPAQLPSADLMYADPVVAAATQPAAATPPPVQAESPSPVYSSTPTNSPYPYPQQGSFGIRSDSGLSSLLCGLVTVGLFGGLVSAIVALTRRSPQPDTWPRPTYRPPVPPVPAASSRSAEAPPPIPATVEDPLNLQPGQSFSVDLPDFQDATYRVQRIAHYTTWAEGRAFNYTAYCSDDPELQLRVERLADGALAVLALRVHDQFEYDQQFYNVVETDRTGLFQITDDNTGEVTAEYRRPEGVLSFYTASVSEETQSNPHPAVRRLKYWDYSRALDTPEGPFNEYVIVEMEESGFFRILLGPQVDPGTIRLNA